MDAQIALSFEGFDEAPRALPRDPAGALHALFGFADFRPGQRQAIDAALSGRDVLVVMPTGSGKSLCYQLPALLRDDLTVVVSPLVSLMQDQVEALQAVAPGAVGVVNAQRDAARNRNALNAAAAGRLKLLYVAPERFSTRGFIDTLAQAQVGLFVVDEAHCVSQWGHDFRPDYFRLAQAAQALGARSVLASTATATPQVAADIEQRLGLTDPVRVTTGFDRPNLSFAALRAGNKESAARGIAAALSEPGALPAIVYAGTRSDCERLADRLERALGVKVLAYHAGMPRDLRARTQRAFMSGAAPIVVATNAFGMGVDKADVRTVCHESVPGSLEAYYQEAGRAGRDSAPARCLLFATGKDKGLHAFFIERGELADDAIDAVAKAITRHSDSYEVGWREFGVEPEVARAALGYLVQAGVIAPVPSTPDRVAGTVLGPWDVAAKGRCRQLVADATKARWAQYRAIWKWVESNRCRRDGILEHFGDPAHPTHDGTCCDACDDAAVPSSVRAAIRKPQRHGELAPVAQALVRFAATAQPEPDLELDAAIVDVVSSANPKVGRTTAVEILRGGRSKPLVKAGYDGLPHYGAFARLKAPDVLARIDELIDAGRLRLTHGRYPKLMPL